jgi:iron complex transport system permease protein
MAIAAAIYVLAWRHGVSAYRFVLVGIGLGFMAAAITSYLIVRANIYTAAAAYVWLTGSLNAVGWETVTPTAVLLAVFVPATIVLASRLRALQLGDDTCRGLGIGVERARLGLLFVGVGLVGAGTAAAGPVAFVAFMAAPIARRLTRTSLTILPAALAGALLVTVADLVGRRIFAPVEIPVGVITGIVGAPYLMWLLARANRIGRGG